MLRLLALLLALLPLAAQAQTVPQDAATIDLTFAPVVKRVAPAVVNIYSASDRGSSGLPFDDPIFREFFGDEFGPGFGFNDRSSASLGSGVIVEAGGLIVTNEHVVKAANEITVILADGREFPAKVVIEDERTDLAVLRIDPKGETLPTVEFRDSDALEVGDLVLAIGNPFGVGQTVTLGIVSALARTQVGVSDYSFFIQTDAAINPGNSGGALVGADGRLVGINTAIYSQSGGSIGIGFAIPSNMVQTVIAAAENGGTIERPWAGLRGETVTAELAPSLGLTKPGGVVVNELFPGGPADRAGLQPGDVVLTVGGQPVSDVKAMNFRMATMGVGKTATLGIQRKRKAETLEMVLEAPPEDPPSDPRVLDGHQPLGGATVVNLSPALAENLGLGDLWQGVMVLKVARGSPARRLGFRPGDLIRGVNGESVADTAGLEDIIKGATSNVWQLDIERDGHRNSFEVKG